MAQKKSGPRAALYARYSSDLQNPKSIDDQFALAWQYAARQGFVVVAVYSDAERSSKTLAGREGVYDMLEAAKARAFDVLIVEDTDRLSRDRADLPMIHKMLEFSRVTVHSFVTGAVDKTQIGLKALFGDFFFERLAAGVRRGHAAVLRDGRIPGAPPYGYRPIPGKKGEAEIDPEQAKVIRRIFEEYASGRSPREIAAQLTRDGIASPSGRVWNHQSFVGGRHKRGIISNPIYRGELHWFTHKTENSPYTGKNVKVATPEAVMVIQVPQLRIIDQPLWDAAHAVRHGRAVAKFGPDGKVQRRNFITQHSSLLAGLLKCDCCGSHMRIAQQSRDGGPRVACAAAHQHRTCSHTKSYDMDRLEAAVLDGLRSQLGDPQLLAEFLSEFHEQRTEQARRVGSEATKVKKRLADIQSAIVRMVDALENGTLPEDVIVDRLQKLETERVGLKERARLLAAETNVVELHPVAIARYKREVEVLHISLKDKTLRPESRAAFRNLVDSVVVKQTPKRMPYEIAIYGRLGALLGIDLFPTTRKPAQIVAEQGSQATIASSDPGGEEKSVSS